jgi:hypothetical protein
VCGELFDSAQVAPRCMPAAKHLVAIRCKNTDVRGLNGAFSILVVIEGLATPTQARLSAYAGIRQHTSAYVSIRHRRTCHPNAGPPVSIRRHTSAYVSIRQHTSSKDLPPQRRPARTRSYQSVCVLLYS